MNPITNPDKLEHELVPTDPDSKARYLRERETKLSSFAVNARARAFRAAVLAKDYARASNMFLAEIGGLERLAFIRECEGTELVDFVRTAKSELREAVIAAHPNRATIERELAPHKAQRLVAISRAVINGELAHVSGTTERPLTDAAAKRLREVGIEVRPWKGPRDDSDPAGWYRWDPDEGLRKDRLDNEGGRSRQVMSEKEFLARIEVDDQFREQFTNGNLLAKTIDDRGAKLEDHKVTAALRTKP